MHLGQGIDSICRDSSPENTIQNASRIDSLHSAYITSKPATSLLYMLAQDN